LRQDEAQYLPNDLFGPDTNMTIFVQGNVPATHNMTIPCMRFAKLPADPSRLTGLRIHPTNSFYKFDIVAACESSSQFFFIATWMGDCEVIGEFGEGT
jgi:hypothetical protein